MNIYKSLYISIVTVMKNPEMLKFVSDHLKTKAKLKITYLLRYVPDQYKTQQMSDKTILENGGTFKSVPCCYKKKKMCNKALENYPHAL